ncbi:hypothetical protein [Microbacterium rhizomatis]|uniref:Uncharacterized protein n=1 Tax=Microbacterium rhizomatis TaxID=1631477 RepID=A0A5J5J2E3_9MICO|nr:hypothetical protein [Microbacterium rhizomatis]KAA9107520.1 hypothetical protein F6B43_08580 [Microbacterium rhizomatis]
MTLAAALIDDTASNADTRAFDAAVSLRQRVSPRRGGVLLAVGVAGLLPSAAALSSLAPCAR